MVVCDPDDPPQLPYFEKVGRRFVPTDYSPEPVAGTKAEEIWRPMAYVAAASRSRRRQVCMGSLVRRVARGSERRASSRTRGAYSTGGCRLPKVLCGLSGVPNCGLGGSPTRRSPPRGSKSVCAVGGSSSGETGVEVLSSSTSSD